MDGFWLGFAPWFALAGLGALHGLNPASGWLLAAACGWRSPQRAAALRALGPIALGHALSVGLVAGAVALGLGFERGLLQWPAACLLLLVVAYQGWRHGRCALLARSGTAGLALSSFIAATAQGSGLMLVPALVPLCLSDSPAKAITASGSLALSLAAVAVHLGAMLVVTALLAVGCGALARRAAPMDGLPRRSCCCILRGRSAAVMQMHELIQQLAASVPEGAPPGTRRRVGGRVDTGPQPHEVVAEARIDTQGRRRERWYCDGVRLQRHELMRLSCAETECPQAMALREQWAAFCGRRTGSDARAAPAPAHAARPLMHEVPISVAGHQCVARPASFRCFTPCPNGAHPALWIAKQGYDLFEEGRCVGGGLRSVNGISRPHLPNLQAAEAYLLGRQLEARAVLQAVADRSR